MIKNLVGTVTKGKSLDRMYSTFFFGSQRKLSLPPKIFDGDRGLDDLAKMSEISGENI
jgi:hypothetical protein